MADHTQIENISSEPFSKIGLILRGAAMGVAEVIPGVSGGTIAFITGIYKTLLDSIRAVDGQLVKLIFSFQLKQVWKKLNGPFLLWLMSGMVLGIGIGVFGISFLLVARPEILWALFFGLILASIPYMLSQLSDWKGSYIFIFVVGAVIAYGITSLTPAEGSSSYLYVFIAGSIAISALVLPGISGSFILLLMGLYTVIIPTIRSFLSSPSIDQFILLAVFGLGCLTGLMVFSRLVSGAFDRYPNITISLMSGFMLGSLNKIWPWRNPSVYLDKSTGLNQSVLPKALTTFDINDKNIKILQDINVGPASYYADPHVVGVCVALVLGIALVFLLTRADKI